jgi:valyl-tRNA synthetase
LPAAGKADPAILEQGLLLKEAVTTLGDTRNKAQIKPKEPIHLHIQSVSEATYRKIGSILSRQVNASIIEFTTATVPGSLTVVSGKDKYYICTEQTVDTGNQKEEMQKELIYLKGFLESVNKKLGNERFVQNAKPEVIDMERKKQVDAEAKIKAIVESLADLP